MSQPELLAAVIGVLEKAGIPYMLTGSHVSSSLGQARSTHDIDFVIQIRVDQVDELTAAFTGEKLDSTTLPRGKQLPDAICSN